MDKCTQIQPFVEYLFDEPGEIEVAGQILAGMLKARSPRLSDVARAMPGGEAANYKRIQRFLDAADPQQALLRLFLEEAPFVIGDPTELERPQARRTEYVGTLRDQETSGYWLLLLAAPYRGRALPCHFVDYSSKTIAAEATSRNRYHFAAFATLKELLGERPLVLDREFSYLELLQCLVTEQVHFVIRLKVGPKFVDQDGKLVALSVSAGETRVINHVFYMGKVCVNLVGVWRQGFADPLWIMSDLPAEQAIQIYSQRMKIEEAFRDIKSLLGLPRLMNKHRQLMQKMVALLLIAYALALVLGEALRDLLFPPGSRKHRCFSGPFVFLKINYSLSPPVQAAWLADALASFSSITIPVRTHV